MRLLTEAADTMDVLVVKDAVGALLRTEASAAAIYECVLGTIGERAPRALREIQAEHLLAAHQLRGRIDSVRLDALDPEFHVELAADFVPCMVELAARSSRAPELELLREVECGNIGDYECALAEHLIGSRLELLVSTRLLPASRRNLRALQGLLSVQAA